LAYIANPLLTVIMRAMIPQLLVVEDDPDIQEYLKDILTQNGFTVKACGTGTSSIKALEKGEPDLMLLDLRLPDMAGESVLMEVRKNFPRLPIIILSGKDSISDKVQGFGVGADDYITKPFVTEELIARIKARLRPRSGGDRTKLQVADLELNREKVEVTRAGQSITLTPQEFKLLEYLMANKGIVLTRDMILNRIWLYSPDVESRVVDVYMGYLRKKIDSGFKKKLLHSVRGFGYTIKD